MAANRELLKHELREDEGFREKTYPGPVTGLPHIGYGHLLGQEQTDEELKVLGLDDELDDWNDLTITVEQAEALLDIDIDDAIESLAPTFTPEDLELLDPQRYIALMSMAFQVGGYGIQRKFPSFVKAVKAEDWDRAADEMMWSNGLKKQRRSAWYKQTPERCQDMADKMRGGTQPPDAEPEPATDEMDLAGLTDPELFSQIEALLAEVNRRLMRTTTSFNEAKAAGQLESPRRFG